jgi:hypothetical protein
MLTNDRDSPIEVLSVAHHDLDLIGGLDVFQIAPKRRRFLARAGRLQVEDDVNARIHRRDVEAPTGFQKHRPTSVGQAGHEWEDVGLKERLASGDLHQLVLEGQDDREQLIERPGGPLMKGVGSVAIRAAQVASRVSHEDARQARECAFSLKTAINLMNDKRAGALAAQRLETVVVTAARKRRDQWPFLGDRDLRTHSN